ncbi:hypothetical protein I7X12_00405 [Halosimplex litoreum]|uniref:MoaB/Mog domain-containing protein n=1 Tax=Halosimplex litoreum TaxID=1198301 RepID=A0A7T3FYN2_9EURY|nr:hypothetical protein I7X12_00405 [Halosimplex litoreum]
MVDFQSRDTSRGYGDDEDEAADAEGDETEGAEGEPTDEPVDGEPAAESTESEPADESAVDSEADDASTSESGDTAESVPEASDDESDADAFDSGTDPLASSSGGPSADPLAPDTGDAGTDSSESDVGTDLSTDDAEDRSVHESGREPTDDGRGVDPSADDPLSQAGESDRTPEEADDPGDHPFADDETDAEAAVESDAGRSHEPDEHAHGSGGHSHDSDDHAHDSGGHAHGHAHGAAVDLLGVAVVTVSSTRTREDDASGDVIEAVIEAADHEVVTREILRDDLDGVQTALLNLTGRDDVDVVVTTGGTGVTPDDVTVEGARPLFDRELPGFGELFRILSYEEIGTRAMVSRATAGMVDGVPVFCLPGSEAAARLGTEELVVEEMAHLVSLARRDD